MKSKNRGLTIKLSGTSQLSFRKKETKKTFSQYLNHYRIEKAKNLLIETVENINEISCSIGYNNTTYFSKKFKSVVGISPKEYRKKMQHKGEKNVDRSI